MQRRPLAQVPRPLLLVLGAALALQLTWHASQTPGLGPGLGLSPTRGAPTAPALPSAPSLAALKLASLGEPVALSKALMLYVQSQREDGTGVRLRAWLERIVALDPQAQYPLLAASQVYAGGDQRRTREMLDFVYRGFGDDPDRRWPWLAHAALVARHQLHDAALARRYANAIRTQANPALVPAWAQQLEVFILDDMNEYQSASALIGAMLASGQVRDPREVAFLERRLESISARQRQSSR